MSTENEMPKEAIPVAPVEEQQVIEEGGAETAVATDEQTVVTEGAVPEEVEIVIPPEEIDEDGFPIMPEEAFEFIEIAGMPREATEQIISTSKETIRAMRAQEEAEGELDEKSRELLKGAEDMLKMYWKTYKDIKANLPSKDEMLNHVANIYDTEYFEHHSKYPGARRYGSFVGGLFGVASDNNQKMKDTGDLLTVFGPTKYISRVKDYAYLIRKVFSIDGVNGKASKSVFERAYFIPIMFTKAIVDYVEKGSESIDVKGIRNILKEMDVRGSDGESRLSLAYKNAKFCIDYLGADLRNTNVTGFKNFIGSYIEAAMNDNELNRKKVSDDQRLMWLQLVRGRMNEFITTATQFVSPTFTDGLAKVEDSDEVVKITATSFLAMMIQNITLLPYYNDIWSFSGKVREYSTDKQTAGIECIRYYIGQISYWSWLLLNFTGANDADLEAFYTETKTDVSVFRTYESFKNLDHKLIRSKFFEVFEVSINNIRVLIEAIEESMNGKNPPNATDEGTTPPAA